LLLPADPARSRCRASQGPRLLADDADQGRTTTRPRSAVSHESDAAAVFAGAGARRVRWCGRPLMLEKVKLTRAAQTFPEPATGLPLSGFRIVELTTAWAGPMAGRILANLGAEVVHIEPANNLDSWRSYTALHLIHRYPNQDGGARRYNRASLFNSQNMDKLSLSLDLKAPGGKETFRDLIAKADGLITNFTPGMLQRLGFGDYVLWSINPRLCVVEMPA